jgi:hypothetical protein
VFSSCIEQKYNEENAIEIISEEKESSPIDSVTHLSQKETIDTLNNQKVITNKINLKLPIPDTAHFSNSSPPIENIYLIEKYVKTYFTMTQPTKVLKTTSADNPEGVFNCHTRTEYGNIAMEEYTCDLQLEKTVEFKNYSFEEVNRVLKILYPEVENKVWGENIYGYDSDGGYGCSLEIINENSKIVVFYGCST